MPDACDGARIAAADGAGPGVAAGFGASFFLFLASALWAFADCAEDCVAEALSESALFGSDCADADVAQAITVTKAKAVVDIFLGNKYSDMAAPTITMVYLRGDDFCCVTNPLGEVTISVMHRFWLCNFGQSLRK